MSQDWSAVGEISLLRCSESMRSVGSAMQTEDAQVPLAFNRSPALPGIHAAVVVSPSHPAVAEHMFREAISRLHLCLTKRVGFRRICPASWPLRNPASPCARSPTPRTDRGSGTRCGKRRR